jgi:heme A synthase
MKSYFSQLGRRSKAMLWFLGFAIVIGVLIYIEQIPILYAVATVSLVVLLLIVAFADLENIDNADSGGFAANRD